MNAIFILNILTVVLIIPIVILIVYLSKHLKDKNGEVGVLRKIILWLKIGWIIYLFGNIIGRLLLYRGWSIEHIASIISLGIIPITIIHWWSFFKIRELLYGKSKDY